MHELLIILEHFGGGQGGQTGVDPVRFLLAAFFWAVLGLVSLLEWRRSGNRRDCFVLLAALFGLARELLMFVGEYGSYRGLVQFPEMYRFYPPLEHLLTMLSYIAIIFAFMWYYLDNVRFSKSYLWAATLISTSIYLFAAPGWISFVEQHPGSLFGSYAGDMIFRIAASLILTVALVVLYRARQRGKKVSLLLLAGIGCFFLDEFLMIFNLANSERHVAVFAPIRHNLHIWAIPILIGSYWMELRNRLREALSKSQGDLEARLKAQASLQSNQERYRTLVDNLPLGISLIDKEFRITMVNRKMGELFQRSTESFVGQFCHDQFEYCKEQCPNCSDTQKVLPQQIHQFETEGSREDGRHFAAHLTVVPLPEQNGQEAGFIELVEDITEKKQTEAENQKLQEHLRHAEKMEAIGYLAGGIAHDFNNQLTGVLGYAELLVFRLEDKKLTAYAQNIIDSANRSAALIEQLLAFGRKGKYLSVPVAIEQIVGEVTSLLQRSIDKRIEIHQNFHDGTTQVLGDPNQLQSALLNIALNARDAMPEGGKLSFETALFKPAPDWKHAKIYAEGQTEVEYLRVSIADTGCGMDTEVINRIFEPFFTTKEMGKGTGMGLASVYGTMTNHNGHIDVESSIGKGTTFHLYFPLAASDLQEDQPKFCTLVTGKARILLVDDERIVRGVAVEMLQSLGYQVYECEDGQQAVEYYRQAWREIDLVILDMIMPVMDGRDAFIAMQQINPDVRVILCSGYSLDDRVQSILEEGKIGFVGKPFTVGELSEQVDEFLKLGVVEVSPIA